MADHEITDRTAWGQEPIPAQTSMRALFPVLVVGTPDSRIGSLLNALKALNMTVEFLPSAVGLSNAMQSLRPGLIVLVGHEANDAGEAVRQKLASAGGQTLPIVLLPSTYTVDNRLDGYLRGAVAVLNAKKSSEELAAEIMQLAAQGTEYPEFWGADFGQAPLEDLLCLVSQQMRKGLGITGTAQQQKLPLALHLGHGRSVAEAVATFVERLTALAVSVEFLEEPFDLQKPMQAWAFVESASEQSPAHGKNAKNGQKKLAGARIMVAVSQLSIADALARELRSLGASVAVVDPRGDGIETARSLDPEVIVTDSSDFSLLDSKLLHMTRADVRLRSASLLVAEAEQLWPAGLIQFDRILREIAPLIEDDCRLRERIAAESSFHTRLELTGPNRLARALVDSAEPVHIAVQAPEGIANLDIVHGLVIGARWMPEYGAEQTGLPALREFLSLSQGRVHVERRERPIVANVVAPVEQAFAWALEDSTANTSANMSEPRQSYLNRKAPRPLTRSAHENPTRRLSRPDQSHNQANQADNQKYSEPLSDVRPIPRTPAFGTGPGTRVAFQTPSAPYPMDGLAAPEIIEADFLEHALEKATALAPYVRNPIDRLDHAVIYGQVHVGS